MKRFLFFLLTFALLLSGCEGVPGVVTITPALPGPSVRVEQTPFVFVSPTETPRPTPTVALVEPTVTQTPTQTVTATETASPMPTQPEAATLNEIPADYTLDVALDYAAKKLLVQQSILYTNSTGQPLDTLVLAVVPNLWVDGFSLQSLTIFTDTVPEYELKGQRLEILLPATLPPEAQITVNLVYSVFPPAHTENPDPNVVRPEIYGYTANQLNLVDWYPYIVPYQDGWLLHDPWFYGEHLVYNPANFDIALRFADTKNIPGVASSGEQIVIDGGVRLTGVRMRTFAISLSPDYQVAITDLEGVLIQSYYLPFFKDAGQAALLATQKAVKTYTERFGPYPHKTLTVVQGDFNDGMEYDGLYFLSNAFYNLYDKTERNYLVMVAAHETCHQWWFGMVANDQDQEPWLDESISTYCELLFYEAHYPKSVAWWWGYRIDFYSPEGKIDDVVSSYGGFTPYTNAVYRRGARFLHDLRSRMGDDAFFAFLKDYFTQMQGRRATRADFFRILALHTPEGISDLKSEYFSKP